MKEQLKQSTKRTYINQIYKDSCRESPILFMHREDDMNKLTINSKTIRSIHVTQEITLLINQPICAAISWRGGIEIKIFLIERCFLQHYLLVRPRTKVWCRKSDEVHGLQSSNFAFQVLIHRLSLGYISIKFPIILRRFLRDAFLIK